jgi:hypothetical protein
MYDNNSKLPHKHRKTFERMLVFFFRRREDVTKSGNSKSEADPIGKGLNIFILILHAYSDSKQLCNYFAEVGTKPGKLLQRRNTLEPAKLKVFRLPLSVTTLSKQLIVPQTKFRKAFC